VAYLTKRPTQLQRTIEKNNTDVTAKNIQAIVFYKNIDFYLKVLIFDIDKTTHQ
jgi:hypothetical protein